MKSAKIQELEDLQKDLKKDVDSLKASKVIKYFGSKTFQNGVANQKVNIQIPLVDNPINFADIRVKIISNYNNADYAGFMEKSISTMITNKQFTNKAEKYTFITNKVADGIAIGGCAIVEDKLMIPISLRTTRGTVIKIIMEGYYYDDNAKNCLENATISNIFTNASVYPKASITTTEITTGEEFATGRIIDGKIEYGKRINFGALPNATSKGINAYLSNQNTYLKMFGIARKNDGTKYYVIPSQKIDIELENGWITIKTTENLSMFEGTFEIYYTK